MSEPSTSIEHPSANIRRRYPIEFKRQVVQESMATGASIARVAMAHGLNTNQLHNWRWQYRRGDFGSFNDTPTLLPVHVNAPAVTPRASRGTQILAHGHTASGERIELHLSTAKIVVHGVVDVRALQCMIQMLRT